MANMDTQSSYGEELWRPKNPRATAMWSFMQTINKKHGLTFESYSDLYEWSISKVALFWEELWTFAKVKVSRGYDNVIDDEERMFPRPQFFRNARLNFAENLLYPEGLDIDSESPAIIAATETTRETITWSDLRARVASCQHVLKGFGVRKGDCVAGYVGNHALAVVAMLAATSIGASWTAISPDSGTSMVLDRLSQIEPVLIFADDGQMYNGKTFGVLDKVQKVVAAIPSINQVLVFSILGITLPANTTVAFNPYADQVPDTAQNLTFEQLEPDHPVYILYSSGTTGVPKCIVHGAIGTLLQHKKEHMLHCSIEAGERLFYVTTTTWMMWHWLVSGLASGATLVLYDGSPMRYRKQGAQGWESVADDAAMPRLIDELEIEYFGTSARYLSILEQKNVMPRDNGCSLDSLRAVYNTASPLGPSTFRYVYRAFGPDINLGSITGGTDIISLFGAPCPITPVYAGEVQVPGLGMAIQSWSEDGENLTDSGGPGDLVCVKPFICQPVAFWGTSGPKKYKSSYFEKFPGVWHHGDFIEFNPKTGGLIMLGRSDGVLNPAGIRFGSAEIYNVLLKHFAGTVSDGICIGRRRPEEVDETVVLFVKMEEGRIFDNELSIEIQKRIRSDLTARHVPGIVDQCPEIPVTVNGKK